MSARDFFGVIVRSSGFLMCVYGGYLALTGTWSLLLRFVGSGYPSYTTGAVIAYIIVPPAVWIYAGAVLMRRPDRIVRFAYPFRSGACAKCGYDMRATPGRCPECGTVPDSVT